MRVVLQCSVVVAAVTGGFTVGFVETFPNLSLSGTERVAVAFVVEKVDGTKPVQIQFDRS